MEGDTRGKRIEKKPRSLAPSSDFALPSANIVKRLPPTQEKKY